MPGYKLNPYVHFIEDRLNPELIQHALTHRLTGDVFRLSPALHAPLVFLQQHPEQTLTEQDIQPLALDRNQIENMLSRQFLVPEHSDPITAFLNWFVVRPAQNPALTYRSENGETVVVHTSMAHFSFSPKRDQFPEVFEEVMTPLAAEIYTLADGTKTLNQILRHSDSESRPELSAAQRSALDFLTSPDRQLIKFAYHSEHLNYPYQPFNSVPRSVSHSNKWDSSSKDVTAVIEFHRQGIEDAAWEFDWIEPTINHAFRFPSDAFGGLSYAARFAETVLKSDVIPGVSKKSDPDVLEIGGGTGTFAAEFLRHSLALDRRLNYHILDLSPALIESQKSNLSSVPTTVLHFQKDATTFDLPGRKFELIIANEVIADLPTSQVRRVTESTETDGSHRLEGDGAQDISRYELAVDEAPESFLVNSGVFRLLERVWKHLEPGGVTILSEYGGPNKYPIVLPHLNHVESSIHFGHAEKCARELGFQTKLQRLTEFLEINENELILDGSSEHIYCLNHVLKKSGQALPYAAISKREFEERFGELVKKAGIVGFSFSPLKTGFHFGPDIAPFMVLILQKPE